MGLCGCGEGYVFFLIMVLPMLKSMIFNFYWFVLVGSELICTVLSLDYFMIEDIAYLYVSDN